VNTELAKTIVGLLIDAVQVEARNSLPSYIQDSWLVALSDVLEKGLYHVWVGLLENMDTVKLEAEIVEIIDSREDSDG
jgi:hypothetical protein